MKLFSRSRWGASAARPMDRHSARPMELFVHHTENDGRSVKNFDSQKAAMKGIQNFHKNGRGWSDIGYHYIVFQPYGVLRRARVFVGRGSQFIPAAQLGHNDRTIAVAVYAKNEYVKRSTKRAILALAKKHGIPRSQIRCHSDVVATDCPGNNLRSWVRSLV